MKTSLLSFASCALIGFSQAAVAKPSNLFHAEPPAVQEYASIDSDDNYSSGASNVQQAPPKNSSEQPENAPPSEQEPYPPQANGPVNPPEQNPSQAPNQFPPQSITEKQSANEPQNVTPPAPTTPQPSQPENIPPMTGSIPKDPNAVQNQPIDPSYDE